jgi:penicillin-binding protein 1B
MWTDFMKRAEELPRYSDMKPFSQPSGVVDVQLDKITNLLATPSCPQTYSSAFIVGTEPTSTCDQGNGIMHGILSKFLGLGNPQPEPPPNSAEASPTDQNGQPKKKGLFGKIAGIFKDDKQQADPPAKPPQATTSPH